MKQLRVIIGSLLSFLGVPLAGVPVPACIPAPPSTWEDPELGLQERPEWLLGVETGVPVGVTSPISCAAPEHLAVVAPVAAAPLPAGAAEASLLQRSYPPSDRPLLV